MPDAPLRAIIECFLAAQPFADIVPQLAAVARLNQGTVADLKTDEFGEYIRARAGLSTRQLAKCRVALGAFVKLQRIGSESGSELAHAARGASNPTLALLGDVQRELRKRVR